VTSTRICAVDDIAPGEVRRFEVAGHRVAVVRVGDEFHALGDRCSHADFSLSEGEVWPDECMIECPKHGSRFSLRDGRPDSLPATRPVPVYDVTVDGDDVLLAVPPADASDR
jgi:3-phenylpropionate/trans-cinnamate dioxygenase ferredoxin subunit